MSEACAEGVFLCDVLAQLTELGWRTEVKLNLPEEIPEDFSFDSKTGKLVKTTDATHPEDYITEYILPEEVAEHIYEYITIRLRNTS